MEKKESFIFVFKHEIIGASDRALGRGEDKVYVGRRGGIDTSKNPQRSALSDETKDALCALELARFFFEFFCQVCLVGSEKKMICRSRVRSASPKHGSGGGGGEEQERAGFLDQERIK